MKKINMFSIAATLLVGLMGSCAEDQSLSLQESNPNLSSRMSSSEASDSSALESGSLAAVDLGVAGNFAILSQSGITDVYKSDITGDVGTSPITGAALLLSCSEVVGTIYTVDAAGP